MRSVLDGTRLYDTRFQQGLFWSTVFVNLGANNFALPDDPQSTYVFIPTGAATRTITLPRLIGNTGFGPSVGIVSGQQSVLNGLWMEIVNGQTVAANLLQAATAAGDGATNVGTTIAVASSATQFTMGQYQVINGAWTRIL